MFEMESSSSSSSSLSQRSIRKCSKNRIKSKSRRQSSKIIVSIISLLLTFNLLCTNQNNNNTQYQICSAQQDYDNYDNNAGDGGGGDYYYDTNAANGQYDDGSSGYQYNDNSIDETNSGDNLYADYAEHQQSKMMGTTKNYGGGLGYVQVAVACGVSWFMGGKYHSNKVSKQLKRKFSKEQKQLYTQYYNDVYKLSETNSELNNYIDKLKNTLQDTESKHEMEAIKRDYDEFKQPDIDGDDRISRAEFNMYVQNYLANYPGLTEADYPKFEDFDHDKDGFVSFKEYAQQMSVQAQKMELDQMYGKDKNIKSGTNKKQQQQSLDGLFDSSPSSVGSARTKMYR